MLTADQPINVTAANMTYNQQTGHAEYTGDAQLWQGATSIRAKTITLDEATGNLTAKDARALGDAGRDQDRQGRRDRSRRDAATAEPRRDAAAADGDRRREPAPARRRPSPAPSSARPSPWPTSSSTTTPSAAPLTGTARMVGDRGDLRAEEQAIGHSCWRATRSRRPTSWSTTTPSGAPATPAPPAWSASGATCAASGSSSTSTSRAAGVAARRLRQRALQPQGAAGREPALGQRRPPHLLRRRGALRAERPARHRGRAARRRSSAARPRAAR